MSILEIRDKYGNNLATLISASFDREGITPLTQNDLSQQVLFIKHPPMHAIAPHTHNYRPRVCTFTQEVLIVRKGSIRVDIYDLLQEYVVSKIVTAGDVLILLKGGHGFQVLEEGVEMWEVKNGPFHADDKTRFPAIEFESASNYEIHSPDHSTCVLEFGPKLVEE